MFRSFLMLTLTSFLLVGCTAFKDAISNINIRYTPKCGSEMVDLLDVCLVNWSPANCAQGVGEAYAECLKTGEMPITPSDFRDQIICTPDTVGCVPPGLLH